MTGNKDFDVSRRANSLDQIVGQSRGEIVAPDDDCDVRRVLRQMHRGLAGRVSPNHHDDAVVLAQRCFAPASPIVETRPEETIRAEKS